MGWTENFPSRFTPSVGSGANRLMLSPRAHEHQASGAVGEVQREPHRGAAAQRITYQRNPTQPQLVEEPLESGGGIAVELPVLGPLVGVAVSGLVDGQHVEMLGQHRDIAGEVGPAGRARPAAVQQHHRLVVADTGLVVVQFQRSVDVDFGEARRGFEGDFLRRRRHQTMVSPGGNPNSWFPKITYARSGSLAACTRPACASRQKR